MLLAFGWRQEPVRSFRGRECFPPQMRGDHRLFTTGNDRVLATGGRRARRAGEGTPARPRGERTEAATATQAVRWRRGAARYVRGGSGWGQRAKTCTTVQTVDVYEFLKCKQRRLKRQMV